MNTRNRADAMQNKHFQIKSMYYKISKFEWFAQSARIAHGYAEKQLERAKLTLSYGILCEKVIELPPEATAIRPLDVLLHLFKGSQGIRE